MTDHPKTHTAVSLETEAKSWEALSSSDRLDCVFKIVDRRVSIIKVEVLVWVPITVRPDLDIPDISY